MAFVTGLILVVALSTPIAATTTASIYSTTVKDIRGNDILLEKYRGKVLLIVNVASECGYTASNYKELVLLQEDYQAKGFTVLAFPCNQFGEQEPSSNTEIEAFATQKFGANFPLFSKVSVYGENATELYEYLYETTGSAPSWNFCKYLVDQTGEVVQFFTAQDTFSVIRHSIEYLVSKHTDL